MHCIDRSDQSLYRLSNIIANFIIDIVLDTEYILGRSTKIVQPAEQAGARKPLQERAHGLSARSWNASDSSASLTIALQF